MALNFSTLTKPVNDQVIDPTTGVMRDEWKFYFQSLTAQMNASVEQLSTDPAPADAEYLVGANHAGLSAERLVASSTSITANLATPGAASFERAALTGDVTASANANATTIANDAVSNAKMANMTQGTIKGRAAAAGTGDPTDLTGSQATAILDTFTSGAKGLAPASGGGTTNFLRADGNWANPITSSYPTALVIAAISAGATLDLSLTSYTSFRTLMFMFENVIPSTDDVEFWCRTSTNGGSSFDATAGDYGWTSSGSVNGGAVAFASGSDTKIRLAGHSSANGSISNNATEGGYSGCVMLYGRLQAIWGRVVANGCYWSAFGEASEMQNGGWRKTGADIDAIRFMFESGNIAGGVVQVYGIP